MASMYRYNHQQNFRLEGFRAAKRTKHAKHAKHQNVLLSVYEINDSCTSLNEAMQ